MGEACFEKVSPADIMPPSGDASSKQSLPGSSRSEGCQLSGWLPLEEKSRARKSTLSTTQCSRGDAGHVLEPVLVF